MPVIRRQQPTSGITIPDEIARDIEVVAAIAAHTSAADPHPVYLTQSEGDGRYRQSSVALTDSDIPAAIARDTETAAAITAHVAAADPHPVYLTQSEGDGRYRQSSVALTDSDIPAAIARDTETVAAIAAHTSATDPHPIYLTQSEGDARYRQSSVALTDSDIPAAIARDSETAAAIDTHINALDPHLQYPTQARADDRYGAIKKNIFTGITASSQGGVVTIPHNLILSKVVALNGVVDVGSGLISPNLRFTPGNDFNLSITPANIHVHNMPNNSSGILNKPIKIVVDCLI